MTTTENLLQLIALANGGLDETAPHMSPLELRHAQAALKDWTAKALRMRSRLLALRNDKALRNSLHQLSASLSGLPPKCDACGARNNCHLTQNWPSNGSVIHSDYLRHCQGTDTFDCALQCLRFRSSPVTGPLVPPLRKMETVKSADGTPYKILRKV